jgi:hypothetical protein
VKNTHKPKSVSFSADTTTTIMSLTLPTSYKFYSRIITKMLPVVTTSKLFILSPIKCLKILCHLSYTVINRYSLFWSLLLLPAGSHTIAHSAYTHKHPSFSMTRSGQQYTSNEIITLCNVSLLNSIQPWYQLSSSVITDESQHKYNYQAYQNVSCFFF